MVTFSYRISSGGRAGILEADDPQQVLSYFYPEGGVCLRNDTHVDHLHWVKHFHYHFVDQHSGKVLGSFSGQRPLNKRGR